jgi:AbiV family abortive infection protein
VRGRTLYLELAEAAAENARRLLLDARTLHRKGNRGHACALGILAIEEAAKALIYKQAAEGIVRFVQRKPNYVSTYSERDLLDHKFKHGSISRLLIGAIEYAPFQQTLSATRKQTFARSEVEALLRRAHTRQWIQRTELERGGRAARQLRAMFETIGRLNELKNGGLYVGRAGLGISRPDEFTREDLERVRELAGIVVKTAEQTVSTEFTSAQRKELKEQMQVVAAQARRLQRLAQKRPQGPTGSTPGRLQPAPGPATR